MTIEAKHTEIFTPSLTSNYCFRMLRTDELLLHRLYDKPIINQSSDIQSKNKKIMIEQKDVLLRLWDIQAADLTLKSYLPNFYKPYTRLSEDQKFCFLKYFLLYAFGGIYLDKDFDILDGNLMELISRIKSHFVDRKGAIPPTTSPNSPPSICLFYNNSPSELLDNVLNHGGPKRICGDIIVASKGHPFWMQCCRNILNQFTTTEEEFKSKAMFQNYTCGNLFLSYQYFSKAIQKPNTEHIILMRWNSLFPMYNPRFKNLQWYFSKQKKETKHVDFKILKLYDTRLKDQNIRIPILDDWSKLVDKDVPTKQKVKIVIISALIISLSIGIVTWLVVVLVNTSKVNQMKRKKANLLLKLTSKSTSDLKGDD